VSLSTEKNLCINNHDQAAWNCATEGYHTPHFPSAKFAKSATGAYSLPPVLKVNYFCAQASSLPRGSENEHQT
jgi:hypothetical protein